MSSPHIRPLSDDHVELVSSRNTIAFDHEVLPLGPVRTSRISQRSSPYNHPNLRNSPLFCRSGSLSSWSSLSSLSDIESEWSAELSPKLRAKTANNTKKRDYAYASDASDISETLNYKRPSPCGKSDQRVNKEQVSSSIQSPDMDSDSDSNHIDKPPGEAGRPGRGGYKLRDSVKWSDKTYSKVKKYIDDLVEEKLDCKLAFSKQSLRSLQDVKTSAVDKFSFLKRYRDLWIVDDLIRTHLKVRKVALRKQELERLESAQKSK